LVEASNNIASVGFNFLNEGKLKEWEVKDYVSKNLMLNITSIVTETIKGINASQLLSGVDQPRSKEVIDKLQKMFVQ